MLATNRFRSFIVASFILCPTAANALPEASPDLLLQKIGQAMETMKNYKEKIELYKAQFEQVKETGRLEIDQSNQAFAEKAARDGMNEMRKKDKENLEKMLPSANLCKNVTVDAVKERLQCAVATEIRDRSLESLSQKSAFVSDQEAAIEKTKQLVEEVQRGQGRIFNAPENQDPNEPFKPLALDPSYLMSSAEAYSVLGEEEFKAGSNYVEILIPSINFSKRDLSEMPGYEALEKMQEESALMLSRSMLMSQLQRRKGRDPLGVGQPVDSDMAFYQRSLFGDMEPAAVAAIGNGNASTPTMLLRDKVMKQKLAAQMQLDQFKSSLKEESAQSLLLIKVLENGGF